MSITFEKPRFVEEDELLGESYENISMCYGGGLWNFSSGFLSYNQRKYLRSS